MERSADWLRQAKRDLAKAKLDLDEGFYEWCCFTAQQAAEKAVKAVYQYRNESARGHSVTKLLLGLRGKLKATENLLNAGRILDRYYIESRYPNGFPEGSPMDFFDEKIGQEAYDAADKIVRFCSDIVG
jgi:HEPN domain-containing protein